MELSDILKEASERSDAVISSFIFKDALESQGEYETQQFSSRIDRLSLGKEQIPAIGDVTVVDNSFYQMQSQEFKKQYPELNQPTPSFLILKAKEVGPAPDSRYIVCVMYERYLVSRKSE